MLAITELHYGTQRSSEGKENDRESTTLKYFTAV
jgi:hypothetical protein